MSSQNEVGLAAIKEVCAALSDGDIDKSREIILTRYPYQKDLPPLEPVTVVGTPNVSQKSLFTAEPISFTPSNETEWRLAVFVRDGFIDRYFGNKLIFVGALRIISYVMPDVFPVNKIWKIGECHPAYWYFATTVNQITSKERGGVKSAENSICTFRRRLSQKSNLIPEDIGWEVLPAGNFDEWDGMLHWFMEYMTKNPALKRNLYLKSWYNAYTNLGIAKICT